jgi:hypothetical protein
VKCSHSNTTGFTNSALGSKWRRPEGTANEPINAAEARIIEILEQAMRRLPALGGLFRRLGYTS